MLDQINQYPITTTSLDDLAFFDVDNYKSLAYQSEQVPMSVMNAQFRVNLGNNNLIANGDYSYTLFGSLASNTVTFKNAATNDIIQFRGDNSVYIPTGVVGHNVVPSTGVGQYYMVGNGGNYGFYVGGTNAAAHFVGDGATPNMFFARKLDGGQKGFNAESSAAATSLVIGHRASIKGANTSINTGFIADVTGGVNNYALEIVNGNIKVPSGGIGQSETVTFGGGSTGDIASMTFEEGIYISKTLVP